MSLLFWMSWERWEESLVTGRRAGDTDKVLMERSGQNQDLLSPGAVSKALHGNGFWFPLPIKTEYDIHQFFLSHIQIAFTYFFSKTPYLFMHSRFSSQKCLDLAITWCRGKAISWLLRACCLDIWISINSHITLYLVQVPNLQKYQSTCWLKYTQQGTLKWTVHFLQFLFLQASVFWVKLLSQPVM